MRKSLRALVLGAVVAMVMSMTGAAVAGPPSESGPVDRSEEHQGFFYWGDGVLVITENSVAEICADQGQIVSAMTVEVGSGVMQVKWSGTVPVLVFADPRFDSADPNIGFIFLDEICVHGAGYDLVATGDRLRLRAKQTVNADGVVHAENSIVGRVTTVDGRKARVATHASVWFDAGGLIKLDPFFVKYTG